MSHDPLKLFHPLIAQWFAAEVGTPTEVQAKAWPEIARERHVLITAPTGSGKTLTAFLWPIQQLISGAWPCGAGVQVLYVSPLKALNTDIRENLLGPLARLRQLFAEAGEPMPDIHVQTRSGDTPEAERRRMLRHPPELLITTPESLNLLLSSKNQQYMLQSVACVILDEIHAVAGNKRGTNLIMGVERLARLAGEFQRIAISATVRPLPAIAAFVGGYTCDYTGEEPAYTPRPVRIIQPAMTKKLSLAVEFPRDANAKLIDGSRWHAFVDVIVEHIRRNRSTLVFANSRRLTERLALMINEEQGETLVYAHHGSLSREMRAIVEQRLKRGELAGILATNSLELGIDIGALDEVIIVQTPFTIASTLQRIGRAGHQVNAESRGLLLPTHGKDFLEAAVMARAVLEKDIEPIHPVQGPLDVLAQQIVGMTGVETWDIDDLYAFLRTCQPFHGLTKNQYTLVLAMLAGRYEETRIRELRAMISIDQIDNTITGSHAGLRLVYMSGGTIADRGYFTLRRFDTQAKIGELDEEFVWERHPGDAFALGSQNWRIEKITHNDVLVVPAKNSLSMVPFWRAEEQSRSFHFSLRIAAFLEEANTLAFDVDAASSRVSGSRAEPRSEAEQRLRTLLTTQYCMDDAAAAELINYLDRQRKATRADLPHRHHLLVEITANHVQFEAAQVILHTLWGGELNRPFGMAIAQAWEELHHYPLEMFANNDCVALMLPAGAAAEDLVTMVTAENLDTLLRRKLETTGFFSARFRENAAIALQLPRQGFDKRMPLWMNRLRAKKLLDAVTRFPDFPVLAETWRTCLQDEFDIPHLKGMLDEIHTGAIHLTYVKTLEPSPFAENMTWYQTNQYMYQDDIGAARTSQMGESLLHEVVHNAALRPRLKRELIETFRQKVQRVYPGYSPRDAKELLDWVKERLLIPWAEWEQLRAAMARDHGVDWNALMEALKKKLTIIELSKNSSNAPAAVIARSESSSDVAIPSPLASNSQIKMKSFSRTRGDCFASTLAMTNAGDLHCVLATEAIPRLQRYFPQLQSEHCGLDNASEDPGEWLQEWLRYYGPIPQSQILASLPASPGVLNQALATLTDDQTIILDLLTEDGAEPEACDAENLEILLRIARAQARPEFRPLPIEHLQLFLAAHQGIVDSVVANEATQSPPISDSDPTHRLQQVLDPLLGACLTAQLLEPDILPARIPSYRPEHLDKLLAETGLLWWGCGKKKISLGFEEHRELVESNEPQTAGKEEDSRTEENADVNSSRNRLQQQLRDMARNPVTAPIEITVHKLSKQFATLFATLGLPIPEGTPQVIDAPHLRQILKRHPDITPDDIARIPDLLDSPQFIGILIRSGTKKIYYLSQSKDENVMYVEIYGAVRQRLRMVTYFKSKAPRHVLDGLKKRGVRLVEVAKSSGTSSWEERLDSRSSLVGSKLAPEESIPHPGELLPDLFPDPRARYTFSALLTLTGINSARLTEQLWSLAWEGKASNDSFAALRKGLQTKFAALETTDRAAASSARGYRRGFQRWKATRPFAGNWFALPVPLPPLDALDAEERNKDRVRLLLDRYGILFRELLHNEPPVFRWGTLFRALRLMELSGELLSGQFFEGIPGLQFMDQHAFRELQTGSPSACEAPSVDDTPERAGASATASSLNPGPPIYWLNAADPASLCGIPLEDLRNTLPRRLPTIHVVYLGRDLILISQSNGKSLDIRLPPEHPRLPECFQVLHHLLTRPIQPKPYLNIQTINNTPAPASLYLPALRQQFAVTTTANIITLWKR